MLKIGNPSSLLNRLERVFDGKVCSALDELISRKVPFQLGGMSDPFTKIETRERVTLEYLKILKKFDYPVIISTKSDEIIDKKYLDVICGSNVYIRFSTTVVDYNSRKLIDRGCPELENLAEAAKVLHNEGIPVCFRCQPIIPGHEASYDYLLELACFSNVKHISAEYLKCPIDANKKFGKRLVSILDGNPIKLYRDLGSKKEGREYILPLEYRGQKLAIMANLARKNGITFGFADNDLLLNSDGNACCAASDLYLRNANYFTANIVSLAKSKFIGEKIYFSDYLKGWIPQSAISTYLNSTARIVEFDENKPEWLSYLKQMWSGQLGVFSPSYFDGVMITDEIDDHGLPVFIKTPSALQAMIDNVAEKWDPQNNKIQTNDAFA
ncbi:hypothetical protein [Marinobacter sp. SS13-12]|uniref:hypothetical protein n=1 Tax=Marinobacter sp. SS13-12 TaxID=3050451 RepID=UPI002552E0B7|nr:hypothetical protein [Marinobacter sp. SS13-12]MDK8462021.1 hypothetical protein [Marinobacter sp. SS13-12]